MPARVGFTPTPRTWTSASGCATAATSQNAAELMSPGTSTSTAFNACGLIETVRPSVTTSAPIAESMRSVWSRDAAGWWSTVRPSARSPARSRADFTWALATGSAYSMPWRVPPEKTSGAVVPAVSEWTLAPIRRRGSTMRAIGRERREESPVRTARNGRPARRPEVSRKAVALLPASRTPCGSRRPFVPAPHTVTASQVPSGDASRLMPMPRACSTLSVEAHASPGAKLVMRALPSAMALSIAARWEMDLSPGGVMEPRRVRGLVTLRLI